MNQISKRVEKLEKKAGKFRTCETPVIITWIVSPDNPLDWSVAWIDGPEKLTLRCEPGETLEEFERRVGEVAESLKANQHTS